MGYQPFLIAPFTTGLELDTEPWLQPADAFSQITNGHVHHGVLEKRGGTEVQGEFVETIANLAITGITQADPGVVTVTSAASLSNGQKVQINYVTGMTEVNGQQYLVANVTATTFELTDLDGNNVDTTGFTAYTSGGQVATFPGERLMGIWNYVASDGTKTTLAFTQTNVARYNGTTNVFEPLGDAAGPSFVDVMSGSVTDYVHAINWASGASSFAANLYRLYFCNGKAYSAPSTQFDGIRYYDASGNYTTAFRPPLSATNFLDGARFLFVLEGRLVALSTIETDSGGPTTTTHPQRARWCRRFAPGTPGAFGQEWYETPGNGGAANAPTGDHIISAQQVGNQILVMFTNSIWRLAPTSDPAIPFRWFKINDTKACGGRFASVAYDRTAMSIGDRGIVSTDTSETRRVDERIETFAREEVNNAQFTKVYMKRNFEARRMYMLYPNEDETDANAVLVFDEESGAYSIYELSMNVLGYLSLTDDKQLNEFAATETLANQGDNTLLDYFFDNGETFVGGDRSGNIVLMDAGADDDGTNYPFTLQSSAWNPFVNNGSRAQMGYVDVFVDSNANATLCFEFFKDNQFDPYRTKKIALTPNVQERTKVSAVTIKTPATSGVEVMAGAHGLSTGDEIYIYGVEGMTELNGGPYTVTVVDVNQFDIAVDATGWTAYVTNGIVADRPFYAAKIWKRIYAGGVGYQHKIKVTAESDNSGIRIHAFQPWFRSRGRRLT